MALIDDEETFLDRLRSFKAETWFAKPDALSPSVCASRGWTNVGIDQLQCLTCKAVLRIVPSTLILEPEDDAIVEEFLQNLEWEHDADCAWCEDQCPKRFSEVTSDPSKMFREILVRFQRWSTVWNIPDLDLSAIFAETESFQMLEKLEKRVKKAKFGTLPTESSEKDSFSKERLQSLTALSLLGWEVKFTDTRFTRDVQRPTSVIQDPLVLRPQIQKCVKAGQSIMECDRCAAAVGLWNFISKSHTPIDSFRKEMAGQIDVSGQIIIDEESGEIEDLFRRPYDCTDVTFDEVCPEISTERKEDTEETKPAEVEEETPIFGSITSRPVFGLKCLKKAKNESSEVQEMIRTFSRDEGMLDGEILNPIHEHRFFCPFRSQWRHILDSIVAKEDSQPSETGAT